MVKSLLSLLNSRQNNILTGASILMVAVFASRFLGLIRDRLLFHNFDTATTDIYFGAITLPDLLFQLIIFGAVSVAFIPVYTEYVHKKGEGEAFKFASNILNISFLSFLIIATISFFFVDQINSILLPGITGSRKILTDQATQLMLVAQVILVIGSFFIAVSQSYQRFIIPALSSLVYNLGIIFGILFFSSRFGIIAPAIGVIIGALLHMMIQLPMLRSLGFKYSFSLNFLDQGVKEIFRLMSIRNIGLIAERISEVVSISLATLISHSSVSLLTVAQHLHAVPIGLFGATIAQAALPVLSREQAEKETGNFKKTLLTTMHQILFLTLPAAAMLIVLRIPIVRLVFGASKFGWTDTVLTGRTVAFLALGLVAQSALLLLVRGFYALKDTKTPVIVSLITVTINIILSLVFVRVLHLDIWGLGLSYAITSNISFLLLLYFLGKKLGGFNKSQVLSPVLRMLLAALVAAVALYIPMKVLDKLVFDTTRTFNLIMLTGIASTFGLSIYLLLVWFMKVEEVNTFGGLIKKFTGFQKDLKTEEIIQDNGPVL